MNELNNEKLETLLWNPEFDFGDFKEAARLEGYGYIVLFQTETPYGCVCADYEDLLEVLNDANEKSIFYQICELHCTDEEKSFNDLGHHLERIYDEMDGFYPTEVPNRLDSFHFERTFEISKEDDSRFSIVLDFLTTPKEAIMYSLEIELDEDDLIDGYYFDEYIEANGIDLAVYEERAELEIFIDIDEQTLDFDYHYCYSCSRYPLERLAAKINEDSDFWKKVIDYIRASFTEVEVYFRDEKIEHLLNT